MALSIASSGIAGDLPDTTTNGAVSYYDSDEFAAPAWAVGKQSCHVSGSRRYFDLAAVMN
jgi:hypothetical protein